MQGSGSFSVEATLGSAIPRYGRLLVITNGAYGERMARMADTLGIDTYRLALPETEAPDPQVILSFLAGHPYITHVAMVHLETTTGIINPLARIAHVVKENTKGTVLFVS